MHGYGQDKVVVKTAYIGRMLVYEDLKCDAATLAHAPCGDFCHLTVREAASFGHNEPTPLEPLITSIFFILFKQDLIGVLT